ncbi:hypothetical protein [Polymorphospora lycopeni]|uniref:DUF2637 domain-containing protein n=1 Tax=Polymorphospora lycopeni TaxID=3140240 RepID=A0ABV5CNH3_9ACTN
MSTTITGPDTAKRRPADDAATSQGDGRRRALVHRSPHTVSAHGDLDADLAKAVRHAARLRQGFYVLVLLVALVGQVTGAVQTLDIPLLVAVPAVAALELGGVVVMVNADVRRRLGERALASRLLSAAIAAAAVAFNWAAHPDHLHGGFFSFMSALGYAVWVMHAGNQRRDRLRATGDLPPTPPAYEMLGHWLRHPVITSRARTLAKADGLDLYESLTAARTAIHRERRDAAIAKVLRRKIRKTVDPTMADIAVQVYDLDEIATRLAATADYDGLTALISTDLTPQRIIGNNTDGLRPNRARHDRTEKTTSVDHSPRSVWAATSEAIVINARDTAGRGTIFAPESAWVPPPSDSTPDLDGGLQGAAEAVPADDMTRDDDRHDGGPAVVGPERDDPRAPTETAEAVAYWLGVDPEMDLEVIAGRIGKSLRSVYRHLPPDYPRKPGVPRARGR